VGGKKNIKRPRPIYLDSGTVPSYPVPPGTTLIKEEEYSSFFLLFCIFPRPFFPSDAKKEEKEKW